MKREARLPAVKKPETISEWRERIEELRQGLTSAEQVLTERKAERRLAAGAALVFGADSSALAGLEATERDAERTTDSIKAGLELAQKELARLEAEAKQAAEAERRKIRIAVAEEIKQAAAEVDDLLMQVAAKLQKIEEKVIDFNRAGGNFARSPKGIFTRSCLFAGLRPFLEVNYVGYSSHLQPMARQYDPISIAALDGAGRIPEY